MSKTHLGLPAEHDAGGPPGHEAPRNGYLEGPFASVAKIHIPHRHNTGFHGNWIADAEPEHMNGQP
jgi:hypothetical protein